MGTGMKRRMVCVWACVALVPLQALWASPFKEPEATNLAFQAVGKTWVSSTMDFEMVFPLPLEAVRDVLQGYELFPSFTPHLAKAAVIEASGNRTRLRQTFSVSILAYKYPSEYDLLFTADDTELPRRWKLSWTLASSDGSLGASDGEWVLEAATDKDGRPITRAINRTKALLRKDFPLQVQILRACAGGELVEGYKAIYTEASRRYKLAQK